MISATCCVKNRCKPGSPSASSRELAILTASCLAVGSLEDSFFIRVSNTSSDWVIFCTACSAVSGFTRLTGISTPSPGTFNDCKPLPKCRDVCLWIRKAAFNCSTSLWTLGVRFKLAPSAFRIVAAWAEIFSLCCLMIVLRTTIDSASVYSSPLWSFNCGRRLKSPFQLANHSAASSATSRRVLPVSRANILKIGSWSFTTSKIVLAYSSIPANLIAASVIRLVLSPPVIAKGPGGKEPACSLAAFWISPKLMIGLGGSIVAPVLCLVIRSVNSELLVTFQFLSNWAAKGSTHLPLESGNRLTTPRIFEVASPLNLTAGAKPIFL